MTPRSAAAYIARLILCGMVLAGAAYMGYSDPKSGWEWLLIATFLIWPDKDDFK